MLLVTSLAAARVEAHFQHEKKKYLQLAIFQIQSSRTKTWEGWEFFFILRVNYTGGKSVVEVVGGKRGGVFDIWVFHDFSFCKFPYYRWSPVGG